MTALDDLKSRLRANSPARLYEDLLVNGSAHYFVQEFEDGHERQYEQFRSLVGVAFGVAAADVSLIGSARVGFSLNPTKHFRQFDATSSDFDIVVVSDAGFEELWEEYLSAHYARSGRRFSSEYYDVFRRFLTTNALLSSDPTYLRWEKRLGPLRREIENRFYFDSRINFRVYRDWRSVERYHVDGFRTLQNEVRG